MSRPNPLVQPALPGTGINIGELDRSLAAEVNMRSGTEVNRCYHCRACANGCPFVQAMDYRPHGVLRLLRFTQNDIA